MNIKENIKNKKKLDFVIVVEGKADTNKLQSLFDVQTIETNGSAITSNCINLIKNVINQKINIVFLLDPDVMGNKIRDRLNNLFPDVLNLFVQYSDMDKSKEKIGIAETRDEILVDLLTNINFTNNKKSSDLVWSDILDLNIIFDSKNKEKLINFYHLPKVNNKKLFQYLKMLKISKEELKDVINK